MRADKFLALKRKQQSMRLKKCIYSRYCPLSSTHLWLRYSNFFNPFKKTYFGCAANRKLGNRKSQRLISITTYKHCVEKYPFLLPGIEPQFIARPSHSLIIILTELMRRETLSKDLRISEVTNIKCWISPESTNILVWVLQQFLFSLPLPDVCQTVPRKLTAFIQTSFLVLYDKRRKKIFQ
jgi:hypothetical protein